jgi:hypothetical protein
MRNPASLNSSHVASSGASQYRTAGFVRAAARAFLPAYQPRARHPGTCGRSVPTVVSPPWPG